MKVLITACHGRTGTTILQDIITKKSGIINYGEGIDIYNGERGFNNSIEKFRQAENGCCKLFFDMSYQTTSDVNSWYKPMEVPDIIQPNLIINSFREDTFDLFLSWQISYHNNKWNATNKLNYHSIEVLHVEETVDKFVKKLKLYEKDLEILRENFKVLNISYEDIVNNNVDDLEFDNYIGVAKQNTLEEKIRLVDNIDEVKEQWQKYV